MTGRESWPNRLNPGEIAYDSKALWQDYKDHSHPISPKVAVALRMGVIGRDLVKEALNSLGNNQGISPDINFVIRGLNPKAIETFQLGLGGILLASIVQSLEDGVLSGWNDKTFFGNYNDKIIGTPMPALKEEQFENSPAVSWRTSAEESDIILQEVKKDNSFLGFFDVQYSQKLPGIVLTVLEKRPLFKNSLLMVLPIYKEAVEKLPKS